MPVRRIALCARLYRVGRGGLSTPAVSRFKWWRVGACPAGRGAGGPAAGPAAAAWAPADRWGPRPGVWTGPSGRGWEIPCRRGRVGSGSGFNFSAVNRRNFGENFVFGSYQYLVYRCFSVYFVPNFEILK